MKKIFIIGVSIFFLKSAISQTTVTFDTKTENFKDGDAAKIIFDEPFRIKILDPDLTAVTVKFGIHDHGSMKSKRYKKRRHYRFFPTTNLVDNGSMILIPKVVSSTGNFTIIMPPLHPNENYDVTFVAQKKLDIEKTALDKLRSDITEQIEKTFSFEKSVIDRNDLDAMRSQIGTLISNTANSTSLFRKDNTQINLSEPLVQSIAESHFTKIAAKHTDLNETKDKICGTSTVSASGSAYDFSLELDALKPSLLPDIIKVMKDKDYKEYLDAPVNTVLNAKTTNRHILTLIKRDLETASVDLSQYAADNICDCNLLNRNIVQLLAGQGKIVGNIVVTSKNYDITGGRILLSALLSLKDIMDSSGNHVVSDMTNFNDAIFIVAKWINYVAEHITLLSGLEEERNEFPNVLEDVYINWYTTTDINLNVPIDTKETPYVGIDFGVLVAPEISTTFAFEGINFHLKPVSRSAKFSSLEGLDWWLKRTSITIGVGQRINTPDDRFEKLISIGSPFIGAGFRINRMIRLSGGFLFYKEKDEIPVITQVDTKRTWAISASLDIKLKEISSIFGKLIKI